MTLKKALVPLGVILLVLSMCFALVACGDSDTPETTAAPSGDTETTAPPATTEDDGDDEAPSGEVKTLKIGTIMGLTGPLSVPALAFNRTWDMYAEVVKEQGGVKIGDDTYYVEFIHEDSKGAAEGAGTAASKLINQDGVDFILGGMLENELAAIHAVSEPAGVLFATANINVPGHDADISPDKDLFVRLAVSPDENHLIDLDYLIENYPEDKKIAIVGPDIGYEGMVARLEDQATGRGFEVVHKELWAWGTTDFVPIMTKVNASKPDIIWSINSQHSPEKLKAARQLGFKGPFVSNAPTGSDVFVVIVQDPEMLTDVISNSPDVLHPTDAMKPLMERWANNWPNDPFITDAVHSFDMPWILVQAMQKAGSIDPRDVLEALDSMTNPGDLWTNEGPGYMGGEDRFGVNRVLFRPFPLTIINDGETEFIGFMETVLE